jgi:outer membrane protein assembly factor BamA
VASSIGNTLTASVDRNLQIDEGNNVVESIGIKYDTTNSLNPLPNGTVCSAKFFGSFRGISSDYEYSKGELELKNTLAPPLMNFLESDLKFYFPLRTEFRPISEVYFAGGYELLRGYNYREFFGDSLMYYKLNYHIPIIRNVKEKALRSILQIVTIDIASETAQLNSAADFGKSYDLKSSVSLGAGCDVLLFKHINFKFDTFAGKALEPRNPVIYFILNAYSYFSV